MDIIQESINALHRVKELKPLIHNITNYVTVNDCANIILAVGGSPIMADEIREVEDMVAISSCLVINMGTLNARTVESMLRAGKKANQLGKPVVFDPVGVGASPYRNETAALLLKEIDFSVIRGNMSEIQFLSGLSVQTKGVDSLADEEAGQEAAVRFALAKNCIAAVTGQTDIITDGKRVCRISNGHPWLKSVTGTGCMSSALVGTFCGACQDYFVAAAAGIMVMGLAGELAHRSLKDNEGIGTFRIRLFDGVSNLTADTIKREGRMIIA